MPSRQTRYDYLLDELDRTIATVDALATTTASDLATHEGAADPHPGYLTTAEGNAAFQPLDTQLTSLAGLSYGSNTLKVVRVNAGESGFELATISGGAGTVTDVSVVTVNGVSGSVATSTTTPAISLTLGAITPTSVAASGTVTGSNLSGTNTGNQTSIVGITGTLSEFNTALTGADFASGGGTATGTNTGDQTTIVGITGTKAQFDTAVTDGNILYVGDVTQYTDELAQDAVGAMVDGSLTYVDATPLLQRAALTGAVTATAGSNATLLGSFTTAQLNTALSDNDVATGGGTASGTNTGDQTTISGLAGTATALATPRNISITGKATAAGGNFDGTAALALNVTAVTLVAGDIPNIAESQVTNLVSDLAAKQPLDTQLTDLAALAYAGNTLKVVRVNAGETAFELATPTAGSAGDLALNKHVLAAGFTVTAAYASYIPRYLEIGATFTLEIGAGGDLEIG